MEFNYNDGGRSKYFKATNVGDCVTRAIAIATGKDYKEVYNRLNEMAKKESTKRHRGHKRSQSRNGVFKETWKRYLKEIGWVHHKTCELGSKAKKVKFIEGALPSEGKVIVQLSRHLTCLVDGVINDTYDCSKKDYYDFDGNLITNDERCVYGYWTAPTEEELASRKAQEDEAATLLAMQQQALNETKAKIEAVKKEHTPKITKLEKKIKELQHQLKLETNRMNRKITKIKEADGKDFCEKILAE